MKNKAITFFIALTTVVCLMAGCGRNEEGKEQAGGGGREMAEDTENTVTTPVNYANKQIIIGVTTETTGDITPFWTNSGSDHDAYQLTSAGMEPVVMSKEGKWIKNQTVIENIEATDNEDESRTYTITLKDGLRFNDGSAITAKEYVFGILFRASDEVGRDLEAIEASSGLFQYYKGYQAYSSGESNVFEGVHLIDDLTYSVTIDAQYLPYYYEHALLSNTPESLALWLPEDVTVEETESGAKMSDNFTAEYIGDKVQRARYRYDISAGPYMFVSYDENAYTYKLTRNPNFAGDYNGQTANIETVLLKYVTQDTMMDQLKTGAVDLLYQVADGEQIEAGLDLTEDGAFDFLSYDRAGYGMISFKCNQGPTQFKEVRQAIACLLDRVTFAQTFTNGHGMVVNGPYGTQQWMAEEYAEEMDELNAYTYSLEAAIAVLEEGGWTYNADGSVYTGEGIRHKKMDDGSFMPCRIQWFSSENNSISDLLVTSLQKNPDLAAAGIEIVQTVGSFSELLTYYYDNSEENPYQMFNLATGFGNPYDVAYLYEPDSASNINAITGEEGQKLYALAVAMNQTQEGDDMAYAQNWFEFISYWNELLPEIPLYSNRYHDFFTAKLHDFEEDGYNRDIANAILYANME